MMLFFFIMFWMLGALISALFFKINIRDARAFVLWTALWWLVALLTALSSLILSKEQIREIEKFDRYPFQRRIDADKNKTDAGFGIRDKNSQQGGSR
jgi:hypothetical protein